MQAEADVERDGGVEVRAEDEKASDLVFGKILRRRAQLAEAGHWHLLLSEYCSELREARSGPRARPARNRAIDGDEERADRRTVALVKGDAVGRAKHVLLG